MPTINVYRKDSELKGKKLSSNTLASFLVAQGVSSIADLTVEHSMPTVLMTFLNRKRAIGYWIENGWLTSENSFLYLTESGLDEVQSREAGVALNINGKKKGGNVTPALVAEALSFIETGKTKDNVEVISDSFQI